MRFATHTLAVLVLMSFAVPARGQTGETTSTTRPGQEPSDALSALATYYSDVNARDYRRAYELWDSPPSSFEQFARGFADTHRLRLLIEPPVQVEGAAGSVYAEIPAIVVATTRSGRERVFAGCYIMRRSNVQDRGWRIYRGELAPVTSITKLSRILSQRCHN